MTMQLQARGLRRGRAWTRSFRASRAVWAQRSPWLVCALFFAVGLAVSDDYPDGQDPMWQIRTARITLDYVTGRSDRLLDYQDRMYGAVIEIPLLWAQLGAERWLGWQDAGRLRALRFLLTHLLFLAGGLACYDLARRLYGRRLVALGAMGLFLLHPLLYAHSFFNSKDIPFLSLFMLVLWLLHRAFRRGSVPAFLLCGIGAGICANVRLMGLLLVAAVLALRALDYLAADRAARRQILRTGGAFAAASALTVYALLPYLWGDPVHRLAEILSIIAAFPEEMTQFFRGRYVSSLALPPEYVPVWFVVTTPPLALALGGLGLADVVCRGLRAPDRLLRCTSLRFRCLLIACFAAPALAVILLQPALYDNWRHLYFVYAPFCLLAAGGLHALATAAQSLRGRGQGWARGLTLACVAAPLAATATSHPAQHHYFNALAPAFRMGHAPYLNSLQALAAAYPDGPLNLYRWVYNRPSGLDEIAHLPVADRPRFRPVALGDADFAIQPLRTEWHDIARRARPTPPAPYAPVVHRQRVHGAVYATLALNPARAGAAAPYRAHYRAATAHAPAVRADFDVYLAPDARTVSWIKRPCAPADLPEPRGRKFVLHVVPRLTRDLSPDRRRHGFETRDFYFVERGVRLDGACMAVVDLPRYPIAHLTVGQRRGDAWQTDTLPVPLAPLLLRDYRAAYRALTARPPAHDGPFAVYLHPSGIAFARSPCAAADTDPKFVVHVESAAPRQQADRPFNNQDFRFPGRGLRFDDRCLAAAPFPAYPVRRLSVGQWRAAPPATLWRTDLRPPPRPQ